MKDTTIAVGLAKNVFEIAISREAGKVSKQLRVSRPKLVSFFAKQSAATVLLPWCTTPIEAESSLGPDSHHPIISLSGIPSVVMVLRILHPILASTLCAANPLARIDEPTIAL